MHKEILLKNPLEQFEILMMYYYTTWNSYWNSNSLSFFAISCFIVIGLISDNSLGWESLITNTAENGIEDELKRYSESKRLDSWPFIITMPYVILTCNWMSFLPQFFVSFSTIVIPSFVAMLFFIYANALGLAHAGYSYLGIFCPIKGEYWLRPIIFIIEIFAFFAKYLSIALRLFANILSGHVILEVLGSSVSMSFFSGNFLSFLISFLLTVALFVLELFIAFAQAFLFIILMCMYASDFN